MMRCGAMPLASAAIANRRHFRRTAAYLRAKWWGTNFSVRPCRGAVRSWILPSQSSIGFSVGLVGRNCCGWLPLGCAALLCWRLHAGQATAPQEVQCHALQLRPCTFWQKSQDKPFVEVTILASNLWQHAAWAACVLPFACFGVLIGNIRRCKFRWLWWRSWLRCRLGWGRCAMRWVGVMTGWWLCGWRGRGTCCARCAHGVVASALLTLPSAGSTLCLPTSDT